MGILTVSAKHEKKIMFGCWIFACCCGLVFGLVFGFVFGFSV
jgi:hypothetical protein